MVFAVILIALIVPSLLLCTVLCVAAAASSLRLGEYIDAQARQRWERHTTPAAPVRRTVERTWNRKAFSPSRRRRAV